MAANQFGFIWRFASLKIADQLNILINPVVKNAADLKGEWETCPSFPFMKAFLLRFEKIEVEFYDNEMNEQSMEISGREAREFQ